MHLHQSRSVNLPEQLVGEFHSQPQFLIRAVRASHYRCKCRLGDVSSGRKRCDPERTGAASETAAVPRRTYLFSAMTWLHQRLENVQSQHLYLRRRNARHPPCGRKGRKEEPVGVTSVKTVLSREEFISIRQWDLQTGEDFPTTVAPP